MEIPAQGQLTGNQLSQLNAKNSQTAPPEELGQAEFLRLMIAQIQHQDPLAEEGQAEFIAQMAQFSSVDGISKLVESFEGFSAAFQSNQTLQGSTLVGQTVLVPGSIAYVDADNPLQGMVELGTTAKDVVIRITNAAGEAIEEIKMGDQLPGQNQFFWNGQGPNGEIYPPGEYHVRAEALVNGQRQSLDTFVNARVESVSLGRTPGDLQLNLRGGEKASVADVKRIADTGTGSGAQSSLALQGSLVVGRNVLVPSSVAIIDDTSSVDGLVDLGNAEVGALRVSIVNEEGEVVREMDVELEPGQKGEVAFNWDGMDEGGDRAASGTYSIRAEVANADDVDEFVAQIPTYITAKVESVSAQGQFGSNDLALNLAGGGTVLLSSVLRITQ